MNGFSEISGAIHGMARMHVELQQMEFEHIANLKQYLPNGARSARIKGTTRTGLVVNCKDTSQHGLAGCFQTTRKGIVSHEWIALSKIEFLDEVNS